MKLDIDRKSRLPIYAQIVERIKELIETGEMLRDERLPTERELSLKLNVSRNTVSQAYHTLETEGYIRSKVGHGTFVSFNSARGGQSRNSMLQRHIRHSIEEGLSLGFSLAELGKAVAEYIEERSKMIADVVVVFIECNYEQANYFGHHLDLDPGVEIKPVILSDLRAGKKSALAAVENADIIATSFYHMSEVGKLVEFTRKKVVAVSLEPDVSTLIRVARLPSSITLGVVTTSDEFLEEILTALRQNGITFDSILTASLSDTADFERILNEADSVIVSPGRRSEIEERTNGRVETIEFVFSPDRTSINNLNVSVVDLEKANKKSK